MTYVSSKKDINGRFEEALQQIESITEVFTEQDLAKQLGIQYVRFAISDHYRPSDQVVDQIVSFAEKYLKPKTDYIVHVHCRGGSGRTTTIKVLWDMILNGKDVSKEDVFVRQVALGGKDLRIIKQKDPIQDKAALERREFIDRFYEYVRASDGLGVQPWSSWIKKSA